MKILKVSTQIFALIFLFFAVSSLAQTSDESIYTLKAGTTIQARMDNEINSKVSSAGDTFTVTVSKPVTIREVEILPVGTVIEGRIIRVKPAAIGGDGGSFEVKFETICLANGAKRTIDADLVNEVKTKTSSLPAILSIVGGTALGALIGSAAGKENGTLIGAGIGAGAGTGAALLRKGKEARIKSEEEIEIRLKKDVTLPVEDY